MKSKKHLKRIGTRIYKKEVNSDQYMNKKGIFLEMGAIILIILTTAGVVITVSNTTHLYVGDKNEHFYIDYYKCKTMAENIKEENLIVFPSEKEAKKEGYKPYTKCT